MHTKTHFARQKLVPLPADMNKCIDYMQYSLSIRIMKAV